MHHTDAAAQVDFTKLLFLFCVEVHRSESDDDLFFLSFVTFQYLHVIRLSEFIDYQNPKRQVYEDPPIFSDFSCLCMLGS